MTSHTDILAAVARGAALLDSKVPDWETKVNPNILNMRNGYLCIAGQALGVHYAAAVGRLGLSIGENGESDPVYYGFNLGSPHPVPSASDWAWLVNAWTREISRRRQPATPKAAKPRKARVRKPVVRPSAKVAVTYAPGQNISVTRRGDVIVKVTTWTTGIPNSTVRH